MAFRNATREHRTGQRHLTPSDWTRILDLYNAGKTDLEIADEVGCASKTIGRWRHAEELPRNDRKGDAGA